MLCVLVVFRGDHGPVSGSKNGAMGRSEGPIREQPTDAKSLVVVRPRSTSPIRATIGYSGSSSAQFVGVLNSWEPHQRPSYSREFKPPANCHSSDPLLQPTITALPRPSRFRRILPSLDNTEKLSLGRRGGARVFFPPTTSRLGKEIPPRVHPGGSLLMSTPGAFLVSANATRNPGAGRIRAPRLPRFRADPFPAARHHHIIPPSHAYRP
jgi:hypothetical protein